MDWKRTDRNTITSGDYRITRVRFPDSCWYYLWRGPDLMGTYPSADEAKQAAEKDRELRDEIQGEMYGKQA